MVFPCLQSTGSLSPLRGGAGFWWHWLSAQYPEFGLEDAVGSCTLETRAAPGIPEQDGLQGQGHGEKVLEQS